MHGLTESEMRKLAELRKLAKLNLQLAKTKASMWARADVRRRVLRQSALRTIEGLYS